MNETSQFSETFIQEAEELIIQIEEHVLDLESNPRNKDAINGLFRAIHTIKGSGAMFGFEKIADFSHHVETTLDLVRSGELEISKEIIDLTLASKDQISAMIDEAKGGEPAKHSTTRKLIDAFSELRPGRPVVVSTAQVKPEENRGQEHIYRVRFQPDPKIFSSGMDPVLLIEELMDLGECVVTPLTEQVPDLDNIDPEQCYLSFVAILTTTADINNIRDVFIFVEDTSELEIMRIDLEGEEDIPKIGDILVERGDTSRHSIQSALSKQSRIGDILLEQGDVSKDQVDSALLEQSVLKKKKDASLKETIRVPADRLDRLVNLVGELVITQAQLRSASSKIDNTDLSSPVEEMGRLTTELRDIALNVRMMPIGSTFNRFRRLVRDLSSELGKKIELKTSGEDTEMDKTIIERMGDLLVHLIRNSIDHGIENPEERQKAGKPESGTIHLSAKHEGAHVVISIEDDGKGIDKDVIRNKAIEKGLIDETAELTKQEILGLIMAPGFSTAAEVSNISGRGVGMDVVKKEIISLRGEVEIDSEKGQGTKIRLYLPLTLAIIDGLLVDVGSFKYILPVSIVEECLELSKDNLASDEHRQLLSVRENFVPYVRLRDVFQIGGDKPSLEEAVIVEVGDSSIGIVVDHIIGDHQTVIKSLGKLYKNVNGVSGATILGDGAVALIADVPSILNIADMQEKQQVSKNMEMSSARSTIN